MYPQEHPPPPSRCTVLTAGTEYGGVPSSIRCEPLGPGYGPTSGPAPPRIRAARGAGIAISHPQQLALRTASMARTTALAGMSFSQPSRTNSPSTMPSTDSGIVNRKNIDLDNRVRDFWAQQSPGQAPPRICTLVLAITSSPGLSLLESSLPGHPVWAKVVRKMLLYWQLLAIAPLSRLNRIAFRPGAAGSHLG